MLHGIINVYKEKGFTSHDVVAKLRGIVGQRKIGHTGTLDPDAEGVLPVCFGRGTKVCDLLTEKDKTYVTTMLLGKVTDTQDLSGTVLEEKDAKHLTEKEVEDVIAGFIGNYEQVPPMYSALKVNGKKLYELAREGKVVERKARSVQIKNIRVLGMELPRVTMEVECSKGTYIRTLCHDIGGKLGVGACMETLTRTKVDRFEISDSIRLCEIAEKMKLGTIEEVLLSVDAVFAQYPKVCVSGVAEQLLYNGNLFQIDLQQSYRDGQQVRVYDSTDKFVALYRYEKKYNRFKIVKMFFNEREDRG